MNETVLTVEDAARCFPALVERVHASGQSALLIESGQPVARIVPIAAAEPPELIAFLQRWRIEHPEPDESFATAVEDSRKAVRAPHDPWE